MRERRTGEKIEKGIREKKKRGTLSRFGIGAAPSFSLLDRRASKLELERETEKEKKKNVEHVPSFSLIHPPPSFF